jgi:RimJ/RimL family protein N-acetyltransferase
MMTISEEEKPIFRGEQVYLAAADPDADASLFAGWMQDAEFVRLMDTDPPKLMSVGKHKEWLEKELLEERSNEALFFMIRTVQGDKNIGLIGLDGIRWEHGNAWVGIGLGEREYWGKGYGTDALRVIQRYAFEELYLHRLSLTVFEYNQRAVRSYEKAGFIMEGCARKFLHREDMRYDLIFMGILRDEWERMTGKK